MEPFRLSPDFPDDTVVGLDNGVGDRGFPFDGADGDDCPSPIRTDVAQAIREVTLALPTQTRDAVWRDTYDNLRIDLQIAQELRQESGLSLIDLHRRFWR